MNILVYKIKRYKKRLIGSIVEDISKIYMNKILVTGGCGFIGSRLVKRLSKEYTIDIIDNLSNSNQAFIRELPSYKNVKLYKRDLLDDFTLDNYSIIFHLAATADVRMSSIDPDLYYKNNILVTYRLLEQTRKRDIEKFVFTSSSTVYGEASIPTREDYGPLEPISIYGASKLACEALISSYAHTYGFNAIILRLANIIGEDNTHGVIYDFINKLKVNRDRLEVLGDGSQTKSYLYVDDCIEAILLSLKSNKNVDIFNIGSEDSISVSRIAEIVLEEMGLETKIVYQDNYDGRGWVGDVKIMKLDISKIKSLGWKARYNSSESVRVTVRNILRTISL